MDILDIIKTKRKELNITQEQMAKLLNMPRTTYYNIEANAVTLKIYDFLKIIKILDIPLGYFTDEELFDVLKSYNLNIVKRDFYLPAFNLNSQTKDLEELFNVYLSNEIMTPAYISKVIKS